MIRSARYGTRDLERARTFYDAIAEILGARRVLDRPELSGYQGADGAMFVIGQPLKGDATTGNGTQMVFDAPSRAAVDLVHAKVLELGGKCEGPPGFREPEQMGYFRDPDGNKLVLARMGPSEGRGTNRTLTHCQSTRTAADADGGENGKRYSSVADRRSDSGDHHSVADLRSLIRVLATSA